MSSSHNLNEVSQSLSKKAQQVAEKIRQNFKEVIKEGHRTAVLSTPVDTGYARSNWVISLGSPDSRTRQAYSPYPHFTDPSKFSERANAIGALMQADQALSSLKITDVVHLVNNVNYIGDLDSGSVSIQGGFMSAKAVHASMEKAKQQGTLT